MKISYLNNIQDYKELNRGKYYSSLKDFKIKKKFEFLIDFPKAREIFITDHTSIFFLPLIIFLCMINRKKITLWIIEIFTIEREAFLSEEKFKKYSTQKSVFLRKNFFYIKYLAIYLTESILNLYSNFSEINILISSNLRKEYMQKKFKKINFLVLRNMPLKKDIFLIQNKKSSIKLNTSPFIFLAGNVNNLEDFEFIVSQASRDNIKVLIAGPLPISGHLKEIINEENVEHLGYLKNDDVFLKYQKCYGGLVLYQNNTLNNMMAASCKLFDLMSIFCPVIVSNNLGVIEELNNFRYPYLLCENFNIQNMISLKNRMEDFKKTYGRKNSFTFEQECMQQISKT